MSLRGRLRVVTILVLLSIPFVGAWHYRRTHPRYVFVPKEEVTITIIPGWNLRQVADYLVKMQFATSTDAVFALTGSPAVFYTSKKSAPVIDKTIELESVKPMYISYEGYLAPETYRVYRDASLRDVLRKMFAQRHKELDAQRINEALATNFYFQYPTAYRHVVPDGLTMASIVEDEARTKTDRKMVADILWRRVQVGMPLQVDSSVHYAVDKTGDVFTTDKERKVDSPWNTYKYAGLPPGPICNPSVESIDAALHPTKNDYWYFLSGSDGKMHYAKTLEEHNANRYKYLR